jgi:hypothetical protein
VVISSLAMAGEPILNRDTALSLLRQPVNPFVVEDLQHPWSDNRFPLFEIPFLRIRDCQSGSQPDNDNRMKSRASRQRLDTWDSRKNSLATHINHKIWEPTPYISFTTSPVAIQELADWRANRRGPQTLTVVDPNTRIANGLPILDVRAEMDYYGVKDPYGKYQYYIDHYLCLWEVTGREVIGHWELADLVTNERWYHEIILPAFRARKTSQPLEDETSGLLASMNQLSCVFLLGILYMVWLTEKVICDPSDPKHLFYGDSDTSSEGVTCHFDDEFESDTDDDLEEANATDDMIKIIEGDW